MNSHKYPTNIKMGEEIAFENRRISDFQGLVTLTFIMDRVILHTFMRHSSISIPTYQISLKSKKVFVDGRADVRTYERNGHLRSTSLVNGNELKRSL